MKYDREKVLQLISNALAPSALDCPQDCGLVKLSGCRLGTNDWECKECWAKALGPILAPSEEETK